MRVTSLGVVAICAAGLSGWWNWASRCETGCPGRSALNVREFTPPAASTPVSAETLLRDERPPLDLVEVIDLPLLTAMPRTLPAGLSDVAGDIVQVSAQTTADDFHAAELPLRRPRLVRLARPRRGTEIGI